MSTVDNSQDVIDSRDVIARIEELQEERDSLEGDELDLWLEDNEELIALENLASEAEQYSSDWQYGEALIRDSHFTDYAIQMLEDCGTIPSDLPWYVVVDWEATAKHIQVDYTRVDFDGVDYWIRSV